MFVRPGTHFHDGLLEQHPNCTQCYGGPWEALGTCPPGIMVHGGEDQDGDRRDDLYFLCLGTLRWTRLRPHGLCRTRTCSNHHVRFHLGSRVANKQLVAHIPHQSSLWQNMVIHCNFQDTHRAF